MTPHPPMKIFTSEIYLKVDSKLAQNLRAIMQDIYPHSYSKLNKMLYPVIKCW